ncbi:hypothetical protein C8Q78DRAFT_991127 [Trametes maxima]|nr:hypothetical protein C8Q78DRAFT_991127 [Trametes maxima]
MPHADRSHSTKSGSDRNSTFSRNTTTSTPRATPEGTPLGADSLDLEECTAGSTRSGGSTRSSVQSTTQAAAHAPPHAGMGYTGDSALGLSGTGHSYGSGNAIAGPSGTTHTPPASVQSSSPILLRSGARASSMVSYAGERAPIAHPQQSPVHGQPSSSHASPPGHSSTGFVGHQSASSPRVTESGSPGSGSISSQSPFSSPTLSPSMGYNPAITNSAYQSPALASSGIASQQPSAPSSSYGSPPLASSGARSHYASPGQDPRFRSPAQASSGMMSRAGQGGTHPSSTAMSPFMLNQSGGPRTTDTPPQATYNPTAAMQSFAGAFQSNPQHARGGSNPMPRPSPAAYDSRPRSQSAGETRNKNTKTPDKR